ncbi:MAG: hypothetical protein ACTSXG_00910 [Alphaproteobacteria bacterium]
MHESYSKLSKQLHEDATNILHDKNLWEVFENYGKIYKAGSFFLDLLVYPDLDVYFEVPKHFNVLDVFAEISKSLVNHQNVKSIRLEKELYKINPIVPKGVYLQLKFRTNEDIMWKIDIWSLDKKCQNKILGELNLLKSKIDFSKRELILKIKNMLKRKDGCTPSFSSYHVYKAVLNEELTNIEDIKSYIKGRGVKI